MSATPRKRSHEPNNLKNINKKQKRHWSMGLLNSVDDPELFVESDDLITVIKDKYPKAERHYLVIPKENISSLKTVTKKHLTLLQHMDNVANKLCQRKDCKNRNFKIGYHAEPSMIRLHLHVISDDMNSPCLKTKKHWNSFNTDFFLESKGECRLFISKLFSRIITYFYLGICKQLEDKEMIELPSSQKCKEYINTALKCNKCSFLPKNVPDLKKHLLTHIQH